MSNQIPMEINSDLDKFFPCFQSVSESTTNQSVLNTSNLSKILSIKHTDEQMNNFDEEFDLLNEQMKNVLLTEKFRPSLISAFQADMSSYMTHEKLTKNSRRMQQEYENANHKEREYVFHTYIKNNIENLSLDKYMHYILEKIIEVGPPLYRNMILDQIFNKINKLITDLYACKVIQKGLDIMSQFPKDSQNQFYKYTKFLLEDNSNTQKLYLHKIGSQIFQKCLEVFDGDNLYSLLLILDKYILNNNQKQIELSTDQFGCLIVNKIIDTLPKQIDKNGKQVANDIIMRIIKNSSCLVRRQYANYIIQQILQRGSELYKKILLDQYLIKDFVSMSMDKYGSNVAEKAIIYSGDQWRQKLWEEEVAVSEESFRKLVNDQFANYPIQRLFEYFTYDYRVEFFGYLSKLNQSNFLNHHGLIVWKFAIANFNTKRFAQNINSHDLSKISNFQNQILQQQQLMYDFWIQQQNQFHQPYYNYSQYQSLMMHNSMFYQQQKQMYPQSQQFQHNQQNLQEDNSSILQTLMMVQNQSN